MSQIYFSKLNSEEKKSRLQRLGSSRGVITVWLKGQEERHECYAVSFFDLEEVAVKFDKNPFPFRTQLLCTFELNGSTYFSNVDIENRQDETAALIFKQDLFKMERRGSYRLLTFPIYDVWSEFDLQEVYEGGKVINLKSKISQTGLFKNFLKLVDPQNDADSQIKKLRIRVQDLSTTGMAIHVNELEVPYFSKDLVFNDVNLRFSDDVIVIAQLRVVYIVDYIGSDRSDGKYKVGIHFEKVDHITDDKIGRKINSLLREVDLNQDFENFIK